MPTIRFDKLIDQYLPTHEGTHFHPTAVQELSPVLGDDGYLHIDEQVTLEDYGVPYKQLAFISQSDDGTSNQKVYYLNLVGEEDNVADLEIRPDMAASNARALHVSAGHVLVFRTSYPYNPQTLKKMNVRLRAGTPGDIRIGLVGISDKAYIKPNTNSGFPTTSGSNDMYEIVVGASNVGNIDATYKMFTGYFKGLSATPLTQSFPSPDPNTPYALLDDAGHTKTTTDVAMAIKCVSGDYYIDSLELFDVENTIADLPGGSDVLQTITHITSDGYLTPTEKRWLSPQFNSIVEEYTTIRAQAIAYSVDTTSFDIIFSALQDEISTNLAYLTSGVYFTDLENTATFKSGTIGGITYPEAFRKLWSDYWEARAIIQMEISAVPGEGVAEVLELITLDTNLTPVEKRWLKPQYDAIVAEYDAIYNQATALSISTTAYANAYTALTSEISTGNYLALGNYFTDMTTTATFKDGLIGGVTYAVAFRNLWATYWDDKSAIQTTISSIIDQHVVVSNKFDLKVNYSAINTTADGYVFLSGVGSNGALNNDVGYVYHPTTKALVTLPAAGVDCNAFFAGLDGNSMRLTLFYNIVAASYVVGTFSPADAAYVDSAGSTIVTTNLIIIGYVFIQGTAVASATPLITARSIAQGLQDERTYILEYLNVPTAEEFKERAEAMGFENVFTSLAAYQAFITKLSSQDLLIASGGAIRSDYYNLDGSVNSESIATSGFHISGNGKIKAKELELIDGSIYSGYTEEGVATNSGAGYHLSKNGLLQAKNAKLIGTLRTGEGASNLARIGIKDESGITDKIFTGDTLDRLVINREGITECKIEIEILNSGKVYELGDILPEGSRVVRKYGTNDNYTIMLIAPLSSEYNGNYQDTLSHWSAKTLDGFSGWGLAFTSAYEYAINPSIYTNSRMYWTSELDYVYTNGGRKVIDLYDGSLAGRYEQYTAWSLGLKTIYGLSVSTCRIRTSFDDGTTWGSWVSYDILRNLKIEIPDTGVNISFTSDSGFVVGTKWTLTQQGMYGLSIKDNTGNEYVSASGGVLYALQINTPDTTNVVWGAVFN